MRLAEHAAEVRRIRDAQGTSMSFTIPAVGGSRFIANEVTFCAGLGTASTWVDISGSAAS
jgi:hypothetical protein